MVIKIACHIKGFFINEFLFQKREISNQKIYDLLNSIHFQVRMRSIQENLNNEFYSSLGQKSDELKALFNFLYYLINSLNNETSDILKWIQNFLWI